jgi:hypothetical protein
MIVVPREIALGPLDLDDARAGIGEVTGAVRRRHRLLDRDDQNSLERGHGYLAPLAGRGRFTPAKRVEVKIDRGADILVRPRQAEHVLGEIGKDQVGRDGRDGIKSGLAKLAFDVVFLGEAEAAMGLHAHVGCRP